MATKVVIGGEVRELIEKLKHLERENAQIRKGYQELAKESREVQRIAVKAFKDTRTEGERFKLELGDLRRALKAGALDTDTYRRAADKLKQEFREARQSTNELSDSQDGLFSEDLVGRVGTFAASLASLATVANLVKGAFEAAKEEAQAIAAIQIQSVDSLGKLGQVADSAGELRQLQDLAKELRQSGAVKSLQEGANVAFSLDSAGLKDDAKFFQELLLSRLEEDISGLIDAVNKQVTNFGGDSRRAVNQGVVAAGITQNELTEVLREAAGPAQYAKGIGLDSSQNLALVALLSRGAKSLSTGTTQAERLLEQLDKRGVRGNDLAEIIRDLNKQIGSGQITERDVFTESTAIQAFRALSSELELFTQTTQSIVDSNGQIEQKIARNLQSPLVSADIQREAALGSAEVSKELLGLLDQNRETVASLRDTIKAELGEGAIERYFERGIDRFFLLLGADSVVANRFDARNLRRRAEDQGNEAAQRLADQLDKAITDNRQLDRGRVPAVPVPEAN